MKKMHVRILSALLPLLAVACAKSDPEELYYVPGQIETGTAQGVTTNSAQLHGQLVTLREMPDREIGFIWSDHPTPTFDNGASQLIGETEADGSFSFTVSDLTPGTAYFFVTYLKSEGVTYYGKIARFTTIGPVDMGLSVKWANVNLEAPSQDEAGAFYAWGEIETKEYFNWRTYKLCYRTNDALSKYNYDPDYGYVDNKMVLDKSNDIAFAALGGRWRIPTGAEIKALLSTRDNPGYSWKWTTINQHNGWLVTCLEKNNSIFLPVAGYRADDSLVSEGDFGMYWSSSLREDRPDRASYLFLSYNSVSLNSSDRCNGFCIRPVCD